MGTSVIQRTLELPPASTEMILLLSTWHSINMTAQENFKQSTAGM